MLFILTGEIQTGKTRWLEALISELGERGVGVDGVVAPGIWRERTSGAQPAEGSLAFEAGLGGVGAYEKLGISNRLLPDGPTILFARRRDLAQREGVFDVCSQSARLQLGWEIDDEAIAQVNAHFDKLAADAGGAVSVAGARGGHAGRASDAAARVVGAGSIAGAEEARGAGDVREPDGAVPKSRLLVVDELGRLELECGAGLASAMTLLEAGPSSRYPHALAVVRAQLADAACARLAPAWGVPRAIAPDESGRAAVLCAYGLR